MFHPPIPRRRTFYFRLPVALKCKEVARKTEGTLEVWYAWEWAADMNDILLGHQSESVEVFDDR